MNNIPSLQAFHTAGMWEQYRDDAFAERGVEPRPPTLTGATVAGERHSFLYRLHPTINLFQFISFLMCMHDLCTCVLCGISPYRLHRLHLTSTPHSLSSSFSLLNTVLPITTDSCLFYSNTSHYH
jgi:hypothetical protein